VVVVVVVEGGAAAPIPRRMADQTTMRKIRARKAVTTGESHREQSERRPQAEAHREAAQRAARGPKVHLLPPPKEEEEEEEEEEENSDSGPGQSGTKQKTPPGRGAQGGYAKGGKKPKSAPTAPKGRGRGRGKGRGREEVQVEVVVRGRYRGGCGIV